MAKLNMQAVRGMPDILPAEMPYWHYVEQGLKQAAATFAFKEIRLPCVESTELFQRGIGEGTDIVGKEMYTFLDRNGDSLALRPEGTAGCVRAALQHGLLHNQIQRLWYYGPMFRHERPQKGRYRQFYQFGLEYFGVKEPLADVEVLLCIHAVFVKLGLLPHVKLQINTLGTPEVRQRHRESLVAYLQQHVEHLDEDSKRRLQVNPLRILDSKNPEVQVIVANAPKLADFLDEASSQHFEQVQALLTSAGVDYTVNPTLVRGLDYYTHTVFEWVTETLGAQGTVCAGGRYDGLVEMFGGHSTPAIGCAFGIERLALMLAELDAPVVDVNHFYVIFPEDAIKQVLPVIANWRRESEKVFILNQEGGAFKKQFKRADKADCAYAIILAEDELAKQQVTVKPLKGQGEQFTLAQTDFVAWARQLPHNIESIAKCLPCHPCESRNPV